MTYVFTSSDRIRLDEFLRKELPLKLNEPETAAIQKYAASSCPVL